MEQSFHVSQQCGTKARWVVESVTPLATPVTYKPATVGAASESEKNQGNDLRVADRRLCRGSTPTPSPSLL